MIIFSHFFHFYFARSPSPHPVRNQRTRFASQPPELTHSNLALLARSGKMKIMIRGDFKYFFADFVRKGGGGTPQIRNPSFRWKNSVKGGSEVPPKSVTYFCWKKSGIFWAKKHNFLRKFLGKSLQRGEGGTPLNPYLFFSRKFCP